MTQRSSLSHAILIQAALAAGFCCGSVRAEDRMPLGERDYVSLLGTGTLARAETLFRGRVGPAYRVATGTAITRFEILEVLAGEDPGREASVLAREEDAFPEPGFEVLVFARHAQSKSLWTSVGHFFLGDDLGLLKLDLVRQVLAIERASDRSERIDRLTALAMGNLPDADRWLAWNAAQELFHLVVEQSVPLTDENRKAMLDLTLESSDDAFATYLQEILAAGRRAPTSSGEAAAGGSLFEAGQAGARTGERPAGPAARLRELTERFRGSADPAEKRRILEELSELPAADVDRVLVEGLSHFDPAVRSAAARGLGDAEPRIAFDPLAHALESDPEIRVRLAAAKALARLGGEEAVALLAKHVDDPELGETCLAGLATIGGSVARAILESSLARLPDGPSRRRALLEDLLRPGGE